MSEQPTVSGIPFPKQGMIRDDTVPALLDSHEYPLNRHQVKVLEDSWEIAAHQSSEQAEEMAG